jgi:hypothetical protein
VIWVLSILVMLSLLMCLLYSFTLSAHCIDVYG